MTTKLLKWPFIGLLAAFVVATNVAENSTFGISSEWSSTSGYRLSGGTQPWALAFSLVAIGLYFLLMQAQPTPLSDPLPVVFRRFVAFWLDFVIAIIVVAPILGIVPMLTEWRRTGIFRWHFERSAHVSGDGLLTFGTVLVGGAALVLYYALPLLWCRPSPGTCIAGYQVIPDTGVKLTLRTVILRTLLGFLAVAGAYLVPFGERNRKQGKFWLDKVFNTHAMRME
jgi:hypothetical protein